MSNKFIINFNVPKTIEELIDQIERGGLNLDILLNSNVISWTVGKNCKKGDIVLFNCAQSTLDNLNKLIKECKCLEMNDLVEYLEKEKALHKKYARNILAIGKLESDPWYDVEFMAPMAYITNIKLLENLINYGMFKSFIKINSFGSITYLNEEKYNKLMNLVALKNPSQFSDYLIKKYE